MRRIALIVLMVLLPLQSIWAAAANTCAHERVPAGRHGTDHVHGHGHTHGHAHGHGQPDHAADTDGVSPGTDGDAGGSAGSPCHGHGNAAVIVEERIAVSDSQAGVVPSLYLRFVAERFLESPLRPPVLHLA